MTDQLPLGSWPLPLDPREHSYLLPAPYQDVAVQDDRWNAVLYKLRRRPVLSDLQEGRTWQPAPILYRLVENRKPGRAIDLGCGNGRDAVWLAANGWDVTAVDRLAECEQRVGQLAEFHEVQANLSFGCAQIEALAIANTFDLVLCHYTYLSQVEVIAQRLRGENGVVSLLAHSRLHTACFGSPSVKDCEDGINFWSIDRHSVWRTIS